MGGILILVYCSVTVLAALQWMIRGSIGIGVAALGASALCFFGTATFVGSFLARREKDYSVGDLIGIGSIAAVLVAIGLWLMVWSGFWMSLFEVVIEGPYWALVGIATAFIVTRKKDAL